MATQVPEGIKRMLNVRANFPLHRGLAGGRDCAQGIEYPAKCWMVTPDT